MTELSVFNFSHKQLSYELIESFEESKARRKKTWSKYEHIDCRCADGRFMMSPSGMAVSKTRYISSSETMVNAGIRGWKLHLSEST
jgi:hypothetical protein